MKKEQKREGMTGWICPACGKCHSPFKLSCDCAGYVRYEISGTSTPCEHNWTKICCNNWTKTRCNHFGLGHTGACQWKCDKCRMYKTF